MCAAAEVGVAGVAELFIFVHDELKKRMRKYFRVKGHNFKEGSVHLFQTVIRVIIYLWGTDWEQTQNAIITLCHGANNNDLFGQIGSLSFLDENPLNLFVLCGRRRCRSSYVNMCMWLLIHEKLFV